MNLFLLAGLLVLVAPLGRADEEQDLIAVLRASTGIPEKCAACQRLRIVGTAASVPALSALLGEERTGHAARYALEGMPFPEAGDALRQALGRTSGLTKAGLIDSVGWRRDLAAVPLLTPLLSGTDATLAAAAAAALGRIGGKDALAALVGARDQTAAGVQSVVLNSLLQCAEQLMAGGDARGAAAVYRDLSAARFPAQVRGAAWRGLVLADARARIDLLTRALSEQDLSQRTIALKVLREVNDPQVVKACLGRWKSLPAESELAVLDAAVKLRAEALPAVRAASQSQHVAVRAAAWLALGDLSDPSFIPALSKAAAGAEITERAAARDALSRLRGKGVGEALLKHLASAATPEKAELLRALGERGDTQVATVLLQNASAGPEPVRSAALESLGRLAMAETLAPLLDLAAKSRAPDERDPVLKALYAVCQASRDRDQTARQVVEAIVRFGSAERRQLLPLLAELATPAALDAALAATRDRDAETIKEAVRVLSRWPSAAPASRLLELAGASNDPTLQVLAVRGAIEVAGQEPDPSKRLVLLQQAMSISKRPDEKRQVLGQMGQISSPEALEAVQAELADPSLADEAGLAAVSIAEKLAGANPNLADEVATKVLAHSKSPEIVRRAWALRRKPVGDGAFIQDWTVCGPFRQAGVVGAPGVFPIPFGPEKPGETVEWKPVPRGNIVDLAQLFPGQENCVAYLRARFNSPQAGDAVLLLGSDDGVKAWLNGDVVHANNVDRGLAQDQDAAPIKLKQGANELMLKVTQGGGGWAACARIVAGSVPIISK